MTQETDFLTLADLLAIAEGILAEVQIRDIGLLESAAARPQTTVFGDLAYPTIFEQAAALMHSLARNHPLVDGNKRLAWAGLRTMLLMNGRDLVYTDDEAEEFTLAVAKGELEVSAISSWLRNHLKP